MKRFRASEDTGPPSSKKARPSRETHISHISEAARFNDMVLRKLQRAYAVNPEGDLLTIFPSGYSTCQAGRKERDEEFKGVSNAEIGRIPLEKNEMTGPTPEKDDATLAEAKVFVKEVDSSVDTTTARLGLPSASTVTVAFPLSEQVQGLLGAQADELSAESSSLRAKLHKFIDASQVIWQNGPKGGVAVIRCTADTIVKIVPNFEDYTEYTALQYLRQHAPEIPVPEPLGALTSGKTAYIFMSLVRGQTLESVWCQLPKEHKISVSNQLSQILLKLRELTTPRDSLFGGVGGEGCKDSRRRTRISQKPIRSIEQFEDFIFSNPHFGGFVYVKILRSMLQSHTSRVVFSHGDLRSANIVVQRDQEGNYSISGILDWEMGGFYPDYWESVKATNTMAPQEEDDWYLHLPACASPTSYPMHWLVDRKWDVHVA